MQVSFKDEEAKAVGVSLEEEGGHDEIFPVTDKEDSIVTFWS